MPADKKISALTAIDAVANDDVVPVNDTSAGPATKKATVTQLLVSAEKLANKDAANGYPGLDSSSLIASARIPQLSAAKLTAAAPSILVGRRSGSAGAMEEITLGSGLSMSSGGVLSASAGSYGWDTLFPLTQPVDADFAWVNQGTSTITNTNNALRLDVPATAGDSLRIRKQAAPSTPYVLTVYMEPLTGDQAADGATYGIGFRQSSDGKLHLLMMHQGSGGNLLSIKFTNETTFSASYSSVAQSTLNLRSLPLNWLRISDDGTDRKTFWSADGVTWVQFTTVGRTDFLTANEILFFLNAADASIPASVRVLSWLES